MLAQRSICVAAAAWLLAAPALALDSDSPAVKRLIDSGLKFLDGTAANGRKFDDRVGGQCLIGLCFFKAKADAEHPHVVQAVARCQAVCAAEAKNINLDLYSTGIAIVFLCEVDAEKYRTEIDKLVQSLIRRQKTQGAWGYPDGAHAATCDTSMTQYAVLGLWAAKGNGIAVPDDVAKAAAHWLIRTQDPSGGWGYQGNDPGVFRRVKQTDVRRSLTAAGLGSSYICADLLGQRGAKPERDILGLPAAFQRPPEKLEEKKADVGGFEAKRLREAHADGNRWITQNFQFDGPWLYYYMYGLERCMSFRELVEGKTLSGAWYDRGVAHLTKAQRADGSWESNCGALVDTALAVLFLMRGTKKTIQITIGAETLNGVLIGGRGLPKDTSNVRTIGGQIVGTSAATTIDEMLAILENPDSEAFDSAVEFPPELRVDAKDAKSRALQIERLARLASTGSADVRRIAVETLAASARFEVVPVLIAAIEDQDARVVVAARDGLRRVSRKFNEFGPPDGATAAQKKAAIEQWRAWYDSVAP